MLRRCAQQQDHAAARRHWSHRGAIQGMTGNGGAKQFTREPFRQQVGNRHRGPAQQPIHVLRAQLADATPGTQHEQKIGKIGVVEVGRQLTQQWRKHGCHARQCLLKFAIVLRVFQRALGQLCDAALDTAVEQHRPAVARKTKHTRLRLDPPQPVPLQLHVAENGAGDWPGRVRERRNAKSRVKFFGDGDAADEWPPFQHQRLQSSLRQIKCGNQSIVSRADDHRIAA